MDYLGCGLIELKLAGPETDRTFEGYASTFGNVDLGGDRIEPGAFVDTLRSAKNSGQWPSMLAHHGARFMGGSDDPVGIWLDAAEDGKGLWVKGKLADTQRGEDLYRLLKMTPRPALNGLSIGYIPKEFVIGTKPGEPYRTLKKVELLEISLVTRPMNPKARVSGVKSIDEISELKQAEEYLRDAGLSRKEACALVSIVRRLSVQRDSAANEMEALRASIQRARSVITASP